MITIRGAIAPPDVGALMLSANWGSQCAVASSISSVIVTMSS